MADGTAAARAGDRVFLVKVGSGNYFRFAHGELASMDGAALLEALTTSTLFSTSLHGVALDRCAVFVLTETTVAGDEPTAAEELVAPRLASTKTIGFLVGSALRAFIRVTLPADASGGGGDGMTELLLARMERGFASLEKQNQMKDYNFSTVSASVASSAAEALEVSVSGLLRLPDLSPYMPAAADVVAYRWSPNEKETAASPHLLALLSTWVKVGAAPPIGSTFFDVQPFASHSPMQLVVEDVGTFRGMPDAIAPRSAVGKIEELQPVSSSAVVSVDWKTPSAFALAAKIAAMGRIQALAFASKRKSVPVFITDMATGFRCWIVIANRLYYLHSGDSLSLVEGVALMRYFLARSEVDGSAPRVVDGALCVDVPPVAPIPPPSSLGSAPAGSSSGGGGGGGSGGGGSGRRGGGTVGGSAGKSLGGGGADGRARPASALLTPARSGSDDSDAEISPETIGAIAAALAEGGGVWLE